MPIYFDNSGQGFDGGCFDPDDFGGMSPDTPAPQAEQNPDLFADSYFWSRFTDVTNRGSMPTGGVPSDDEIAAQWAFNGGNPNDLPLNDWLFQARTDYESQAAYNQWQTDNQQAAAQRQLADFSNQAANQISDLQARAEFIMKMQQYLNSGLIDSDTFNQAMRIYDSSNARNNSSATSPVNNSTVDTANNHIEVTGAENGTPTVSGQVTSSYSSSSNLNTFANSYDLNGQNVNYLVNPSTTQPRNLNETTASVNDNFTIYVDLSKKADTEKVVGHPMSYFEYALFLAFKAAFAKRGQHPSDSEISLIAANAAQSGKYYVAEGGSHLTDEALLLDKVSRGYFVISQMQINFGQIDSVLRAAGYDPQTLQRTVAAVTVNDGGSSTSNLTTTPGTIGATISPIPLITIGGISGGSAVLESSLAGSSTEVRAVVTIAQRMASTGVISAELMAIVATLPAAIVGGTLAIDYYFLFDYIINRAKEIAADRAHQEALANETKVLSEEVARQATLSQAAANELAQITVLMNSRPTDYANPTSRKNPLDDTFEDPFSQVQPLTTTGGSGLQPTPPDEPPVLPPIDPSGLAAKILAFVTATGTGVTAADYIQNNSVNQTADEIKSVRDSLDSQNAKEVFDERLKQMLSDSELSEAENLQRMKNYLDSARTLGNGDLQKGLLIDWQYYQLHRAFNLPYGAESQMEFRRFGVEVRQELQTAGVTDAQAYLQGSAITGIKYRTGEIFDVGRTSDWDMAVASPSLFARAQAIGIEIRGGGSRTVKLSPEQLDSLGLLRLKAALDAMMGRSVDIMIYRDQQAVKNRNPLSIYVP